MAQIVSNEISDPNAAIMLDASGPGPFDALFRQLLIKQNTTGADANPLLLAATTLKNDATMAESDLAALLPFLDALGLTQTDPTTATVSPPAVSIDEAASLVETSPTEAALTVLAGPASIPVASHPAISAAATMAGNRPAAQSTAVPNFTPGKQDIATAATDATDSRASLSALSGDASQTRDASAGREFFSQREFSSQLVAAIAASKEQAHFPGSTAAAVQQVIANAAPQAAQTTASPSLPVAQPVGTSGWGEEIGNRVVWMANRMESRAELVLTPPHMGRIEISLSIAGDQATANFVSGNPAVREALEAALPRLREVLADAGIQLGQTQVGAENARQSAQQEKNSGNFGFNRGTSSDNATLNAGSDTLPASAGLKVGRGLVDVFA
ncbi:MAG: flagellar hook-length control protein FliK [Rhodocyclaceae bacterium]|nr:flagellar hook-length control protein FliK [Rhodocyclaceae bacterium]